MKKYFSRSVLQILFLLLSLHTVAQNEYVLNAPYGNAGIASIDTSSRPSVKIAADPSLEAHGFKRFLIGKNYRYEWKQPVRVPVLNLNTAYGGLTVIKEGGGKETRSLRVENNQGKEWALRSVEKFPEKVTPPGLRNTVGGKLLKDAISASYPYGALSMATFSKAVHVPYLKDSLVYLPDHPALEEFRSKFKNSLVLMEEREPSGFVQESGYAKKEKTISTEELVERLDKDNRNRVDQLSVLRARLLDNFVMDFDRHERQWNWLGIDSAGYTIYYPIPTDRDQVFYRNTGPLSKIVASKNIHPETQGFRARAKDIRTFNKPAQSFDHLFLNGLSEDEWSRQIDEFLRSMTDAVIESALHQQPPEIQQYSAAKIIATLKKRRQYFKADMMRYYRFLSKTVSITGTNNQEQFIISNKEKGKVSVIVKADDGGAVPVIYERVFDPSVTKEIRIYGLSGDDKFALQGGQSKIKIRMIGGQGKDEFTNNSHDRKAMVYDAGSGQTVFSGDESFRKRLSADSANNSYNRFGYRYDYRGIGISLEYSLDGGLYIGPKLKTVKQGFRKDPYSSSQLLAINRSVNAQSFHIKYNADFIKVFGNTDLLIRSDARLPTSRTLFFGIGNNTVFDQTKPGGHKYYFARYDMINIAVMARSNFNRHFQVRYGPVFQNFKLSKEENEGNYIATLYPLDGNFKVPYAGKYFAGGELDAEINTKNDRIIPTRGIDLNVYGRSLAGLNGDSHSVNEAGGYLSLYTDFISKKHIVIATSFGAGHIAGDYEFEQAQYLGFKQNLRGFRIDRFAGRSRAYNNSEIRFIWNDRNLWLFRGACGFILFNDAGRVWADNEKSTQWHDGYGWGIFLAPLNKLVVSASMMYSKEESNLLLINFGFQF